MRYGKVTVHMVDGSKETYSKVWIVREIIDSDGDPAKRICFFNETDVILKDKDITEVTYQ